MSDVSIYSNGICRCSVCVPKDMKVEDIERDVNIQNPTGIDSQWEVSKEKFGGGEDNPCQCNQNPERLHYLMVC